MEETDQNVHLEVNELHHFDITPNQSLCKDVKNIAVTAEEITENPEYVVLRKSTIVHALTKEEIVIPKQNPTLNLRPSFTIASSEGGSNTMEIDISSQESAMDIASQESLAAKDSKSEEISLCNQNVSLSCREETVLAREEDVQKREEAVLECEKRLKSREKDIADRERIVNQKEMDIQEREEMLNNKSKQITDRESILKKREVAVQFRELEADGYKVIIQRSESCGNGCLPAKRTKKI